MKLKETAPRQAVVLTDEGKLRFATFALYLLAVDRRMHANKAKSKPSHAKKKVKVRDNRGPCFLEQLIYHGVIILCLLRITTMIDTIVLGLSSNQFTIVAPEKF